MAVASQVGGARAFEINAGEIVEHEACGGMESVLGELFFKRTPIAAECIEGVVKVVFVKGFVFGQAACLGQKASARPGFEGEF